MLIVGHIILVISLIYTILALGVTVHFYKKIRNKHLNKKKALPAISMLKPIAQYEPVLERTLRSMCQQEYGCYQIILGTEANSPQLSALFAKLREENPQCDISIVVGTNEIAASPVVNGKIRILEHMYPLAKYDLLVISDSDMLVGPQYLCHIAEAFRENVGVVTCLYRSIEGQHWAASLEAFAINFHFLPSVLVARLLGDISFAFGATIAIYRDVLAKIGGFAELQNYLADDYLLGNRAYQMGYRVAICDYVVDSINDIECFRDYFLHQLRWAVTYRSCRPYGYFFSIITHIVFLSLLFTILAPGVAIYWLVVALAARWALAIGIIASDGHQKYQKLWLLPLCDIIQSAIWAMAFFSNTVVWAGQRFRVCPDGTMVKVTQT